MPKRGRKRNLSPSKASGSKPKRSRKASTSLVAPVPDLDDVIVIDSDSESDELKAILAQIKAQEESERLVLRDLGQPSSSGSKDAELHYEDDEAMAKRLAAEWAHEAESNNASASSSSLSKTRPLTMDSSDPQGGKSYVSLPVRPDEGLLSFRDIFTMTRPCSKCGKDVQSPRGCVSDIIEFSYLRISDPESSRRTRLSFPHHFCRHH